MNQSSLTSRNKSLVQLGDRFRDLRFAIRKVKEITRKTAESDRRSAVYDLAYLMANASNGVFSSAESGLISVLNIDSESHSGQAEAHSFKRYLVGDGGGTTADEKALQARFSEDQYYTSKRILMMTGNPNALVHQENYLEIWQALRPDLQAYTSSDDDDQAARSLLAARYVVTVMESRPVRVPESFEHPYRQGPMDINLFLASTLALIAGVTEASARDPDSDIIYKSCIAATLSRYHVIETAARRDDPTLALQRFLLHVMDHLP